MIGMLARAVAFSLVASVAAAQADTAKKGMSVRVKAQGFSQWQVGEIMLLDDRSLALRIAEPSLPIVTFPLSAVDSIQTRRATRQLLSIGVGATIGALLGAAIMSRVGQANFTPDAGDTVNQGYLMAIPGGAVGALVGGVLGAKKGPKAWIPVWFK